MSPSSLSGSVYHIGSICEEEPFDQYPLPGHQQLFYTGNRPNSTMIENGGDTDPRMTAFSQPQQQHPMFIQSTGWM